MVASEYSLTNAAYTKGTWKTLNSALNCLNTFVRQSGITIDWPIDSVTINNFTQWSLTKKRLKPKTIEGYLKAIYLQHTLRNLTWKKLPQCNWKNDSERC